MANFVVFSYNVGRKGNGGYIMEKQQMTGKVRRESGDRESDMVPQILRVILSGR